MAFRLKPEDGLTPAGLEARAGILTGQAPVIADVCRKAAEALRAVEYDRSEPVHVYDEKYTVKFSGLRGIGDVLRHGLPWRQLSDSPGVSDFAENLQATRAAAKALSVIGPAVLFAQADVARAVVDDGGATAKQLEAAASLISDAVVKCGGLIPAREEAGFHFSCVTANEKFKTRQGVGGGVELVHLETGARMDRAGDGLLLGAAMDLESAREAVINLVHHDRVQGAALGRELVQVDQLAAAGNAAAKELLERDPAMRQAVVNAVARRHEPKGAGYGRLDEGSTAPMSGLSEQRSGAMAASDTVEGEKTKKPREKAAEKYANMSPAELKAAWVNIIDATTTKRDRQGQPMVKDGAVERFPSFQFQVRLGEVKALAGQKHDAPDLKISEPLLATLKTFAGAVRQPAFSGEKGSHQPTGVVHSGKDGIAHLADNFGDEKAGEKAFRSRAVHLDTDALKKKINGMRDPEQIRTTFDTFRAAQHDSIQRSEAKTRAIQFSRGQAKSAGGAEIGA